MNRLNWSRRTSRMVRLKRQYCLPDIGFEIRALVVWGRSHYLSATEAPHNIEYAMLYYEYVIMNAACYIMNKHTAVGSRGNLPKKK